MLAPMALLVALVRLGVTPYAPWLSDQTLRGLSHVRMVLGMLALMIYRRNEYADGPCYEGFHSRGSLE